MSAVFRRVLGTQPNRPCTPVNDAAHKLCRLCGVSQLTPEQIEIAIELGIAVEVRA